MARKATSKPGSGTSQSSATIGFEATALRVSAIPARAAILRSLSEAKDNLWLTAGIHHLAPQGMTGFVLAYGSMSSNQSGDCLARSASSKPKAKPQSLPRQRDSRRALIDADLVDCMVALPGQLFYGTQIHETFQKAA